MPSTLAKTSDGIGRCNTKVWNDNGHFSVQLWNTVVYHETQEGLITLDNGGWITPTTARRMNQALLYRGMPGSVRIKNGQMFYGERPFDGSKLILDALK